MNNMKNLDTSLSSIGDIESSMVNNRLGIEEHHDDLSMFHIAFDALDSSRYCIDMNLFFTTGTFIVGQKGSGKTYLTSIPIEYIIMVLKKPVIIIDPLGDYKSFDILDNVTYVDIDKMYSYFLDEESAKEFVIKFYTDLSHSYVFDMSEMSKEEKQKMMKTFFEAMERYGTGLVKILKEKYNHEFIGLLVIEEAEKFFPERSKGKSICKQAGVSLFYGIRHCNIGICLISHRISDMDKSVLSDCLMVVLKRFSSVYMNDVEVAYEIMSTFESDKRKLEFFKERLTGMLKDEAIIGYNNPDEDEKKLQYIVNIRQRVLKHDAQTTDLRRVLNEDAKRN